MYIGLEAHPPSFLLSSFLLRIASCDYPQGASIHQLSFQADSQVARRTP
jgi:hypothetical protein